MNEVEKQIEAAYDYRGHVTIALKDGRGVEGYLFNRVIKGQAEPFIEVFPKGSDKSERFLISSVKSVALTGEDTAAGKSFDDYVKKKSSAP